MIISKMFKIIFTSLFIYIFLNINSFANEGFENWLKKFQTEAINSGISENVVKEIMSDANVPWNLKLSEEAKKGFESIVGLAEQQKSEKTNPRVVCPMRTYSVRIY